MEGAQSTLILAKLVMHKTSELIHAEDIQTPKLWNNLVG